MKCRNCSSKCVKNGFQKNGNQRLKCKKCGKRQQLEYVSKRYCWYDFDSLLKSMICNGLGVRNISRILKISCSTVIRNVKRLSSIIIHKPITEHGQKYEIDEMFTFVANKKNAQWIIYALNRKTRAVVSFVLGPRTSENVKKLIDPLLKTNPEKIYTDRLNIYPNLIPFEIHSTRAYQTNHIERNNLTLRMNLKRLQRRSICYSKSSEMLESCLKIYFERD